MIKKLNIIIKYSLYYCKTNLKYRTENEFVKQYLYNTMKTKSSNITIQNYLYNY